MRIPILSALFLGACGPETQCGPGTEESKTHFCNPVAEDEDVGDDDDDDDDDDDEPNLIDPTDLTLEEAVDLLLETFPECELLESSERLDLFNACVEGACAGDTFEEFEAMLGPTDGCEPGFFGDDSFCSWGPIEVNFTALGDPPPASTPSFYIGVDIPFDGATTGGLALGLGMHCFARQLGMPDDLTISTTFAGEVVITDLYYSDIGLFVNDFDDASGGYGSDGIADNLLMFGPF